MMAGSTMAPPHGHGGRRLAQVPSPETTIAREQKWHYVAYIVAIDYVNTTVASHFNENYAVRVVLERETIDVSPIRAGLLSTLSASLPLAPAPGSRPRLSPDLLGPTTAMSCARRPAGRVAPLV